MEKRTRRLGIAFFVLLCILMLRLAYIQILGHEDLSATAALQQQIKLDGADTRGVIFDRNGTPVAGGQQEYIYIIEESECDGETLNALKSVHAEEVANEGNEYRVFTSEKYDKETGERLIRNSGAYILEAGRRYRKEHPAVHLIGYVNETEDCGVSGLELMYDEELAMLNKKVSATADVTGKLLQGHGLNVSTDADDDFFVKPGITTTLELGLQMEIDRILNESGKNCAAVVLDCKNGELLASASTPGFDPDSVETYMESDNGELINKVMQGEYPPGSLFKIVVAAAALEKGISAEKNFTCKGHVEINGHKIKCETGGNKGHGKITLSRAFAESCNCAFIQLARIIGYEDIRKMAESMGLGKQVLRNYPGEKQGNLMTRQQSEGAGIANLAIGQGESLATPVQIAQMTAAVANGGLLTGVKIRKDLDDNVEGNRIMSEETASIIRNMMHQTVKSGTGSGMELHISAGVKTGSAESSQNGTEVIHGWITGYIPAEDPKYVISVFVEDGKSGRGSAAPLFAEIANYSIDENIVTCEIGV